MESDPEPEQRQLSVTECLALLATVTTAHLAVTHKALPLVIPVHLHLVDQELAIESLLGTTFPLKPGTVVALEADAIEIGPIARWTVEVRGYLTKIDEEDHVGHAVPHPRQARFWLSTEEVTGWSSVAPPSPEMVERGLAPRGGSSRHGAQETVAAKSRFLTEGDK